jgi:lysophospholipase-2
MLNAQIAAGTDSRRLFLGGFSQGAVMSLAAGLSFEHPLGGIIAFSGWLTKRASISDVIHESNRNTPILMCHGESDAVVAFALGRKSYELLSSIGMQVQFHSYRNMAHTACPQVSSSAASKAACFCFVFGS